VTTPLNFTAAYKYCRAKGPGYDIASVEDQFENREREFVEVARSATVTFIKYPTTIMANGQQS